MSHFVTHPGTPPKVRHTSRPPIFRRPSTKTRTKAPLYKFCLNCSRGFCPGGLSARGSFVWKVLSGLLSVPVLSEYICYNRKLNITLNFMFRMYDKKMYKCDVTCPLPLPLSQTATPCRTPSPFERDVLYPVSTGILPHSLPEWAFRARPGLWRNYLCPKVARIAEQKFGSR